MSDLVKLKRLIATVDRELAEAKGGLKRELERLDSDHDCPTLKAAKARLKQLDKEIEDEQTKLTKRIASFRRAFDKRIAQHTDDGAGDTDS